MSRAAVFLDRDGTLIRDWHHVGRPEQVELLPGVGDAVRRLNEARWPVIVVTNQSGIARGIFTQADYERVRARTEELLAEHGARLDGTYMCPHHPDFSGPCECRKPGTLLYRQAAEAHGIDLRGSWYIGDKLRDVLAARELGGRGVLVPNEETPAIEIGRAKKEFEVASSLDEAVARVIESVE